MTSELGKQILTELMKDRRFMIQGSDVIYVQQNVIFALPETLKDLLNEKVTYHLIIRARVLFVESCLTDKLAKKHYSAVNALITSLSPEMANQAQLSVETLYKLRKPKIEATLTKLKSDPSSDHTIMMTKLGLKPEVLNLYLLNQLTLANLLLLQPTIIVYP